MDERYRFLDSIRLGMVPDRDFFLKILGYDLSYPGFRDLALNALNQIGCPDPWKSYAEIVTEVEDQQDCIFRNVADQILNEQEAKKCPA